MSPPSQSRRNFIKHGVAVAVGVGVASAIEIPPLYNTSANNDKVIKEKDAQIKQLTSQVQQIPQLQAQNQAIETVKNLSLDEVNELESIIETIIPTDDNGAGGKEAGVIYFIDAQLAGDYGNNARMYMKGPFIKAGQTASLVVDGITYPEGSPAEPFGGPTYQYNLSLKEFWRQGLNSLQNYANATYGKKVEELSNEQRIQLLTDLFNNKPTNFDISPVDFFNELIFLVWSGFFMDPVYGGNKQMVGWKLTGFSGTNMGNGYGEGLNSQTLMVAVTPTRLQPLSSGPISKSNWTNQRNLNEPDNPA